MASIDILFNIIYSTYSLIGIIANALLCYIILRKSPKELRYFRLILMDTALSQLISSTTIFMTQVRIIPSGSAVGLVFLGPCAKIFPGGCHVLHSITLACIKNGLLATSFSMTSRYLIMRGIKIRYFRMFVICLVLAIIPAIILASCHLIPRDPAAVAQLFTKSYPDYPVQQWLQEERLDGYPSVYYVGVYLLLACATIPNWPSVTCMLYSRQKILKLLAQEDLAEVTRDGLRMLVKSLTLQMFIPLWLCTLPVFLYIFIQFSRSQVPILEYLIFVLIGLPPAINPFLTLYIMAPYRRAVQELLAPYIPSCANKVQEVQKDPATVSEYVRPKSLAEMKKRIAETSG